MAAKPKRPGNDEPEPTLEDDLPSDGRDQKGEAMIRDLPKAPDHRVRQSLTAGGLMTKRTVTSHGHQPQRTAAGTPAAPEHPARAG